MRVAALIAILLHASLLVGLASVAPRRPAGRAAPDEPPVEIEVVPDPPVAALAPAPAPPAAARAFLRPGPSLPSPRVARRPTFKRKASAPAILPGSEGQPLLAPPSEAPGDPASARLGPGSADPTAPVAPAAPALAVMATPRYRSNPPPDYPRAALRRREEGVALLQVAVGADGRAYAVALARSSGHPLLDQAATQAVRSWIFDPARIAGRAVASQALVPVRFSMTEK